MELTPGLEPEPHQPKPPEVDVSLSIVESAEALISPKPDGEAESEEKFTKELEKAGTPGNETLRAWRSNLSNMLHP